MRKNVGVVEIRREKAEAGVCVFLSRALPQCAIRNMADIKNSSALSIASWLPSSLTHILQCTRAAVIPARLCERACALGHGTYSYIQTLHHAQTFTSLRHC